MKLKTYDLRDPDRLIEEIAVQHPLREGTVLLAVVADPSTKQELTHVELLPVDSRIGHYEDARDLLYETMQRLPLPDWAGPKTRHSVVTVLVRPGLTVLGRHESQWLLAWRYSNHLKGSFDGDLILVTEHGWVHFPTDLGGHEPRMEPVGPCPARATARVTGRGGDRPRTRSTGARTPRGRA